jgi:lysyl-tRNA synthetase class 2
MEIKEILRQREEKFRFLRDKGLVGAPCGLLAKRSDISGVLADFKEGNSVIVAGRLISRRQHGKSTFCDLKDHSAKIQIYIREDSLKEEKLELFQRLDIADIVAVRGRLFKTRTGEPSVNTEDIFILSKALRPLPEKWHGLKDIQVRYRQRYLDLLSNEQSRDIFLKRSRILQTIRKFLDRRGYLEVETPMMHYIPGGASGRPFKTYHNEYGLELYLRIAPELYLKELLVGGLDKVYEINKSFRNEGISTKHNPEFTMLEVYTAYADYRDMMELASELILAAAREVLGGCRFEYQGKMVDLSRPWQEISFAELVKQRFDIEATDSPEEMLRKLQAKGRAKDKDKLSRSQVVKIIEDILQEEMSFNPIFFTDYFTFLCPLAKTKQAQPYLSERFELFIAGIEVANAYSELNDANEQRRRFAEEIKELDKTEKKEIDEDFIVALEHAMPPAGGLGIGIDRLVMLLTNQPSIRDVILFPLLKPQST